MREYASVALKVAAPASAPQPIDAASFKNFHRSLCERFNYSHDEQFWWRDQVSLIEHIAAAPQPTAPTALEVKLRDAVTILRGALVIAECAIKGREHTGFITKALTATEFPPLPEVAPQHSLATNADERIDKIQAAFEAWSKREGALNLQSARHSTCEDGRFPATYYYAQTEAAWRAWANKPASSKVAQPAAQPAPVLSAADEGLYKRLSAVLIENTKLRGHTIGMVCNQLLPLIRKEIAAPVSGVPELPPFPEDSSSGIRFRFFKHLSQAQRLEVFRALLNLSDEALAEVRNHTIEKRLLDAIFKAASGAAVSGVVAEQPSIAPMRDGGTFAPESYEFVELMSDWRFARLGADATRAFRDVVNYIDRWRATQATATVPHATEFPAWSDKPPTEQAWYWHWNGNPDSVPFPLSALYSGSNGKCFVSMGQVDEGAVFCDVYGGYWLRMIEPAIAAITPNPAKD